jgi:hypothetical protein
MAYSIYYGLKPAAIPVIFEDPERYPCLSNFFEPDYRRRVNSPHGFELELFGWVKPRGNRECEKDLFEELSAMLEADLLLWLADDNWISEPRLQEKLREHPKLLPFIKQEND